MTSRHALVPIALATTTLLGSTLFAAPIEARAGTTVPTAAAAESVFFDGSFDEAVAAAKAGNKPLLVYFTATWCGPCKQMQATTWVDEQVVSRLRSEAVVAKVDVDEQRSVATRFGVRAMPTIIAVRGDDELDRLVGRQASAPLLAWFDRVVALQPGQGVELGPVADDDYGARLERARTHLNANRLDEATKWYTALWDDTAEGAPEFQPVRGSFMIGELTGLCGAHEPARLAFAERRDALRGRLAEQGWTPAHVRDFIALNAAVQQPEASLAWFDEVRTDPERAAMLRTVADQLIPLLVEQKRHADAGTLVEKPHAGAAAQLRLELASIRAAIAEADLPPDMLDSIIGDTAKRHATIVVCLVAAKRTDDARASARALAEAMPGLGATTVAATAIEAGHVHAMMLELLDAVPADRRTPDHDTVRSKLRERLAKG